VEADSCYVRGIRIAAVSAALLSTLLLGAILAGCSSSVPTTTHLPSGHAKASEIEALPVPAQAVVAVQSPGHSVEYGLSGVPISSADRWYDRQLPAGANWKDWTWVSPTGPKCVNLSPSKNVYRSWTKGHSMLILGTTPVHDKTTAVSGTGIYMEVLPGPAFHCG
jgi:hypothetical protein